MSKYPVVYTACAKVSGTAKNSAKVVDSLVSSAIDKVKSGNKAVQVAAVAILMHAEKHGDYSRAQSFVDQLDALQSVKTTGLIKWFTEFGGLKIDEEEGTFNGWQGKQYIRDHFEQAKETAWWSFNPKVNTLKGFNLIAMLEKQYKQGVKLLDDRQKAEDEGDKDLVKLMDKVIEVDFEQLATLKNTIRTLKGLPPVESAEPASVEAIDATIEASTGKARGKKAVNA